MNPPTLGFDDSLSKRKFNLIEKDEIEDDDYGNKVIHRKQGSLAAKQGQDSLSERKGVGHSSFHQHKVS